MKKLTNTEKLLLAVIAFLTLIVILLMMCTFKEESVLRSLSPALTAPVVKNKDTISIPGYEGLTLQAGTIQQTLSLSNPPQNTCHFVISLYLNDGTLLWQSEELKPGQYSTRITLNQPLEKGTYPDCIISYACTTPDGNPLNGANTKLIIRAK